MAKAGMKAAAIGMHRRHGWLKYKWRKLMKQ